MEPAGGRPGAIPLDGSGNLWREPGHDARDARAGRLHHARDGGREVAGRRRPPLPYTHYPGRLALAGAACRRTAGATLGACPFRRDDRAARSHAIQGIARRIGAVARGARALASACAQDIAGHRHGHRSSRLGTATARVARAGRGAGDRHGLHRDLVFLGGGDRPPGDGLSRDRHGSAPCDRQSAGSRRVGDCRDSGRGPRRYRRDRRVDARGMGGVVPPALDSPAVAPAARHHDARQTCRPGHDGQRSCRTGDMECFARAPDGTRARRS